MLQEVDLLSLVLLDLLLKVLVFLLDFDDLSGYCTLNPAHLLLLWQSDDSVQVQVVDLFLVYLEHWTTVFTLLGSMVD